MKLMKRKWKGLGKTKKRKERQRERAREIMKGRAKERCRRRCKIQRRVKRRGMEGRKGEGNGEGGSMLVGKGNDELERAGRGRSFTDQLRVLANYLADEEVTRATRVRA